MLPTIRHSLTDNVKDELMRYIRRMDLSESTKLPSELTIAQNLGVSRITVCRVLGDLEQTRRLLDRQKSQDCDELTIACNSYISVYTEKERSSILRRSRSKSA